MVSASLQLGFLSLLCLVDILVSFILSGMPVNQLGVAKQIDQYKQQHLNIFFLRHSEQYDENNF